MAPRGVKDNTSSGMAPTCSCALLSCNRLKVSSVLGDKRCPCQNMARSRHLTHPDLAHGCQASLLLIFLNCPGLHPVNMDTMLLSQIKRFHLSPLKSSTRWANSSLPTDPETCVLWRSIVGIRANNFQPLNSASSSPTIFPLCLSLSMQKRNTPAICLGENCGNPSTLGFS